MKYLFLLIPFLLVSCVEAPKSENKCIDVPPSSQIAEQAEATCIINSTGDTLDRNEIGKCVMKELCK